MSTPEEKLQEQFYLTLHRQFDYLARGIGGWDSVSGTILDRMLWGLASQLAQSGITQWPPQEEAKVNIVGR